jgi:hypothetical protein
MSRHEPTGVDAKKASGARSTKARKITEIARGVHQAGIGPYGYGTTGAGSFKPSE